MYELSKYVTGTMTVLELNGQTIQTGKAPIFLYKLSMQNMIIVSNIQFPNETKVVLQFHFVVKGKEVTVKGTIEKWLPNSKAGQYTYFINFLTATTKEEDDIFYLVNNILLANKKKKLSTITDTVVEISFK